MRPGVKDPTSNRLKRIIHQPLEIAIETGDRSKHGFDARMLDKEYDIRIRIGPAIGILLKFLGMAPCRSNFSRSVKNCENKFTILALPFASLQLVYLT
jgi:hypothetical protein